MSDERCALVLEGGAMRGMYTAGVLDCFMDHDISFDAVIGVSAGALFGVNLLSKQRGRVIRYNKRFNSDKNYMGIRPLLREKNIVSTKYAYDTVPRELDPFDDEEYKKSDIPFYAVVTNIRTGKPEYVQIKSVFDQMDVLRASGSMPVVSKPVKLGHESGCRADKAGRLYKKTYAKVIYIGIQKAFSEVLRGIFKQAYHVQLSA